MPEPIEPPNPVGVPFGRYVIRTRLGRGGMGEVFLADQLGPLGPVRPVALKRLRPALADNPQVVRLFLEEMGTAAQLSHPNIAVTYDFGEVDGVYFLAMEYVDGLPLDQLISKIGPLGCDAAVQIGADIALALQHAHGRQSAGQPAPVVHQDVTPHNVLVARDGETKLLDFGIARTEAAARQGKLRAKVRYAAPEQLRGAPPDRRFDVFGLGVTLYQALSGRLPFPQKELAARVAASEAAEFPALAEVAPEAAHLDGVLAKALHPTPAGRFQDAAELRAALLRAHPVDPDAGKASLRTLVAQVALAPPHLDGGELTSTGIAVDGSVTPPGAATALGFSDDGPTRITRREIDPRGPAHEPEGGPEPAPAPPPDRARTATTPAALPPSPSRRRRWPVILGGLALGAAAVMLARVTLGPQMEPAPLAPVVQASLPSTSSAAAQRRIVQRATSPTPVEETSAEPPDAPARREPPAAKAPKKASPTKLVRPRRRSAPRAETRSPAASAKATPAPAASTRPDALGLLSVRTVPWSRVLVDGRPLGEGVIAKRALRRGPHRLRLEAGEGDFEAKEIAIEIREGDTTRVFFDFAAQRLRIVDGQ